MQPRGKRVQNEEQKKTYGMRPSRVVPNHGTTRTRPSLTSLFEWEAVTLSDVAVRDEP